MLFDSLNTSEQELFVNTILKSVGIDVIKTALFKYFSNKILQFKPYNENHIKTINQTLSHIIHARDSDHSDDNESIQFKLDELSPPLISNIASFLNQQEYTKFQKVNRKIFIGCRNPYSLTELSTTIDNFNDNISRFGNVTTLSLSNVNKLVLRYVDSDGKLQKFLETNTRQAS